jgi:hypothetical protein
MGNRGRTDFDRQHLASAAGPGRRAPPRGDGRRRSYGDGRGWFDRRVRPRAPSRNRSRPTALGRARRSFTDGPYARPRRHLAGAEHPSGTDDAGDAEPLERAFRGTSADPHTNLDTNDAARHAVPDLHAAADADASSHPSSNPAAPSDPEPAAPSDPEPAPAAASVTAPAAASVTASAADTQVARAAPDRTRGRRPSGLAPVDIAVPRSSIW